MQMQKPQDVVATLMKAINQGDIQSALDLYTQQAVMAVEPGVLVHGKDQLREALTGFIALKPTMTKLKETVIETADVALYSAAWTLTGIDPSGQAVHMQGHSADILQKQADGSWLISVDNPWGTALLD